MLQYEEALEEADMLGAKVESLEAKAMQQKEARTPTHRRPRPGPRHRHRHR